MNQQHPFLWALLALVVAWHVLLDVVLVYGLLEPPGAPQLSGCADRDHRP